jgi:hypothetical protein
MPRNHNLPVSSGAVNQPAGNFTVRQNPPFRLDRTKFYEICVAWYSIFFTIANIKTGVNDSITITQSGSGSLDTTIVFPQGNYTFEAVVNIINAACVTAFGAGSGSNTYAVLSANEATQGTTWTLSNTGGTFYTVTYNNAFNTLIGFTGTTTGPSTGLVTVFNSQNQADFAFNFSSFNISFNESDPNYCLSTANQTAGTNAPSAKVSNIILTDSFVVANGLPQVVRVNPQQFFPLKTGFVDASEFVITILDQNGVILDFQQGNNNSNNQASIQFIIREIQ